MEGFKGAQEPTDYEVAKFEGVDPRLVELQAADEGVFYALMELSAANLLTQEEIEAVLNGNCSALIFQNRNTGYDQIQ